MENRRATMDFKPNRLPVYTRQALLAEIKRVVAAHFAGLCPTHRQFNQFSRVHSATVAKEFGSWAEAMGAAGFEYSRSRARPTEIEGDSRNITPNLLMKELRSIAHKHNTRVFQYEDYRRLGGKRARGTFCKYLGGWRQAVASIGLKDGFSRPRPDLRTYTDEDYFAEMQRLWETLGRQPTTTEMRKYGKIPPPSRFKNDLEVGSEPSTTFAKTGVGQMTATLSTAYIRASWLMRPMWQDELRPKRLLPIREQSLSA